ncbi:Ferrochelatase, protoheme ferro-lyase [Citrifermentans bremense]|uniref:Ferrochelatase n=1 Tax=Citrifermentans bremense TaxID=60035 RepID=A0A6S6LTN2_9BACT|nr:ferrochelatase [Citrifermentans bremense]BCG45287.1 Ferrochelatase, protoheme ferro-lyase [Citrifermentans bremense]
MSPKTALLLLQMGGPDSLEAVHPFLMNLFTDRDIIKIGPAFLQPFIARRIVNKRAPKVEEYYRQIGGKSPIRELTEAQGEGLQQLLGEDFRSFVAMRYSRPTTIDALAAIKRAGIERVIALSLYPHYSKATTGSSVNELKRVLKESGAKFEITYIDRFYNHPLYIKALSEKVMQGLAKFPDRKDVEIVFSAHSLPQSFIEEGDPYLDHIQETVRLVMEQVGEGSHTLCFQSKASRVKWLEPSTEATIEQMAKAGKKNLLMVPLSFVSDHIETLYEIDIQYGEEAKALGIERFIRTESLNSSPLFLQCLADLVKTAAT